MQDEQEKRKDKFLLGGGGGSAPDAPAGRVAQLGAFANVRVEQAGGRPRVKKTYDPQGDEVALQHLKNELALAGRMRHPNIIGPDTIQKLPGNRVELSMDYAAGGSLADYVKRAK